MRKDWKYILYLSLAFGLFLLVKLSGPKQYDWMPTYAAKDKNPFGAYVLNELLPDLFAGQEIVVSNQTIYELKDSLDSNDNLIILTHSFQCEKDDAEALLKHVEHGATVFAAAQSFYGKLADTLKLSTADYLFKNGMQGQKSDTSFVRFLNSKLDTSRHFSFKRDNIHNYFDSFDTTRTSVIAENDLHQPVIIRTHWGNGNLILSCIPLAYTNIYTLRGENHEFVATALSYLPVEDTYWTEYYSIGRMEASSPLRFILTREPLAWAYYISVIALILFMFFEAKRKQRIIPIIKPLENTSLEFVGTIGNLYYHRGDHKNLAEKKITFFFEHIRTRFQVNPSVPDEKFVTLLSRKADKPEDTVRLLFQLIDRVKSQVSISKDDLVELNNLIESFEFVQPFAKKTKTLS